MRVMIYYLYVCRIEAAKTGLLHACAIVILKLSCERDFCIALNQRYPGDLPIDIPKFDGTYADLLILICHKLMMSSEEILKSVFHVLLTILYNVSPYITNLSVSTSSKLVSLFELFSSKKFLLASPNNQQYIIFLLDIFNNLIHYQYSGNSRMIYTLLRKANVFYDLYNMGIELDSASPDGITPLEQHILEQQLISSIGAAASSKSEKSMDPGSVESSGGIMELTAEFMATFRQKLPLQTIFALAEFLVPKMKYLADNGQLEGEEQVLTFLEKTSVVGILPPPHPVMIRRYISTTHTTTWFTTYIWGVLYLRNIHPPLFDAKLIRLFAIARKD